MREWGESEAAAEFDEGQAFVGGGHSAAEAGLEQAALGTDKISNQQRFFFKTGAAEGRAFSGLFDGAGGNG